MRGVVLLFVFACAVFGGEILCNLCQGVIDKVSSMDGHRAREYLDGLCDKVENGFLSELCTKVADFGVDKLFELIDSKIKSLEICEKIHLC